MGKRRLTWLVLVFGVLLVAIFLIKDPLRRGIRYFYSEILFPPLRLSPENKTPPIILITVDTLRADHLGSYGYPRLTSPNIDSLAIDGITFEQAFTAVPKTSPSLASIMSGMYPRNHRIFTLKIEMNENLPTVPKILNERGYLTAGICGQINCDRRFGFARGFDYYFDDYKLDISEIEKYKPENGFSPVAERRAEDVINHAINWLSSVEKSPRSFFLWVHLMDPHAGYSPPEPYNKLFTGTAPFEKNSILGPNLPPERIHEQAIVKGESRYSYYLNHYDGEIAYADSQIGRLLSYLKKQSLYDNSLILLSSDHGEYMGESSPTQEVFSHGDTLRDSELHVPLIIKMPANYGAGLKNSGSVSLIDLAPTMLSLSDSSTPADMNGSPLIELSADSKLQLFSREFSLSGRPRRRAILSIRTSKYKLIINTKLYVSQIRNQLLSNQSYSGIMKLYDLINDPLERTEVSSTNPKVVETLMKEFNDWIINAETSPGTYAATEKTDPETIKMLQTLGYVN